MPILLSHQMFKRGWYASSKFIEGEPPGYICPICLRIVRDAQELTREHVPPKSMGGRVICLTCKNCNNRAGHTIDAAMNERRLMSQVMVSGTKGKQQIQLRADGLNVNASLVRQGSGAHFNIDPRHNDPHSVEQFNAAASTSGNLKLEIYYRNKFSERQAMVGYLRAAYLFLFAKYGYEWILHRSLDTVREQIKNPENELIWKWWLRREKASAVNAIYFCDHPLNCALVAIAEHVIVIPSAFDSSDPYALVKAICLGKNEGDYLGDFSVKGPIGVPNSMELLLDFL